MIVATGNYRTGSTLVFNLAREMCFEYDTDAEVIQIGYSLNEIIDLVKHGGEDGKRFTLKSHEYIPDQDYPKLKCLHTTRNLLDAFASSVVLKGTVLDGDALISLRHQRERDKIMSSLNFECVRIFKYEEFYGNLKKLITDIADYLGFTITKEFKQHLMDEYDLQRVKKTYENFDGEHDLVKWFRPKHVSYYNGKPGYYTQILTQEQIEQIESIMYE